MLHKFSYSLPVMFGEGGCKIDRNPAREEILAPPIPQMNGDIDFYKFQIIFSKIQKYHNYHNPNVMSKNLFRNPELAEG